eukprot:1184514-Prorocentrum_minimum.AAC.1
MHCRHHRTTANSLTTTLVRLRCITRGPILHHYFSAAKSVFYLGLLGATGVSRHSIMFAPVASAGGSYRGLREGCVQQHNAMCTTAWANLKAGWGGDAKDRKYMILVTTFSRFSYLKH